MSTVTVNIGLKLDSEGASNTDVWQVMAKVEKGLATETRHKSKVCLGITGWGDGEMSDVPAFAMPGYMDEK